MFEAPRSPTPGRGLPPTPPGTWYAVGVATSIVCPEGHDSWLASETAGQDEPYHTVAADGTVHPSVVCPWKGCTWHVFARLLDWVAPDDR